MKFFKVWATTFYTTTTGGYKGEVIINPSGIAYTKGSKIYMINGDWHDCGGKDIEELLSLCGVEVIDEFEVKNEKYNKMLDE